MILRKPFIAIVTLVIFVPIAFVTTYLVSVFSDLIAPFFPFISDTGTLPPASCLFGQFLDIGAILLVFVTYVRYLHIKSLVREKKLIRLDKICLALGFMAAFGLTMVGNFQETNIFVVHMIGALMAFAGYLVYLFIDTYLARKLCMHLSGGIKLTIFRLVVCSIASVNLLLVIIFTNIASSKFDGQDPLLWKPDDGGYAEHLVATTNEWCMSGLILVLMSTFIPDFMNVQVHDPQVGVVVERGSKLADNESIKISSIDE